jgi:hypothetical protein
VLEREHLADIAERLHVQLLEHLGRDIVQVRLVPLWPALAMLAWRGKGRDELLAALRQIQGGAAGPGAPAGTSRAALDVPAPALAECLDGFWSPGLSRPGCGRWPRRPLPRRPTCCCACSPRRPCKSGART